MFANIALSRGVTAHRLSKNATFFMNEGTFAVPGCRNQTSERHKPLLLMLPWLGSRPHALAKYCDIYFNTGFDVLVFESEVQGFLWPRWGLEHGKTLLELLESERFVSRPLLVHAFSIGGYTFSQLLVHVSKDTDKYQAFTERITGQIYDSMVAGSLEHMAIGLGKTVFPKCEWLVKQTAMFYFDKFKSHTVDYFDISLDVFWNTPITAPVLMFYCNNDPLCDPQTLADLAGYWRGRGMDVTEKKWDNSIHAGHLKRHPEEYLSTLRIFLSSLGFTPLKAKL
ncbi:uncharacterized protein si:dkey-5i3.5 [Oreochromis niloticus]|uniref:Uncharacterized LOC100703688 n=1 Tax=Oreochromis niloticus TaxID=8128 RepID=I3KCE2_ORENI|nr:uncharacterized protein LOC100703688 [Oreochromis niloticus]CAI5664400.1 unnamed protein product [Mustela putorius furo]